jgi:transcriptional regulator GlxA family with amidase domain
VKAQTPLRRVPVYVVLPPRTMLLDLSGPLEVLRRANVEQDRVRFDVHYLGQRSSVTCSIGLPLGGLDPLPDPDTLPPDAMVMLIGEVRETMGIAHDAPASNGHAPDAHAAGDVASDAAGEIDREAAQERAREAADQAAREAALEADRADEAAIVDWLRATIRPGHVLVSICSGALLAARAGLLDGYACTTHYVDCANLARLAPNARVLENRLYVEDRDRFTSAGVTTGVDLMLHLVSRFVDHACALAVARYLVVYLRRGGSDPQLSPWLEGRNHIHPAIHRVQDAVAANPARNWTLDALADVAGSSPRHLSRLFNEHVGMSITDFRNRLRVAVARELLGHTRLDMERIAERAGFASTRQLRRAWRQLHPTPPKQARNRMESVSE